MIEITTGRRLHFGLFTPVPLADLKLAFGGVGVMVDAPGITLRAWPDSQWSVHGPICEQARGVLERLRTEPGVAQPARPIRLEIAYATPAHQGWGTGTQLGLAMARLWHHAAGLHDWSARQAAEWIGRGKRSGIGIAGFDRAGLLIDQGKPPECPQPSEVERVAVPPEWTWLLVQPQGETGLHAEEEQSAFLRLPQPERSTVDELMHLGKVVMPQSARARNFGTFARALSQYNLLAGSFYRSIQGGDYGSAKIAERIAALRELGAVGVGQSSWGPGVFAVFQDEDSAHEVRSRCRLPNCELLLAKSGVGGPSYSLRISAG